MPIQFNSKIELLTRHLIIRLSWLRLQGFSQLRQIERERQMAIETAEIPRGLDETLIVVCAQQDLEQSSLCPQLLQQGIFEEHVHVAEQEQRWCGSLRHRPEVIAQHSAFFFVEELDLV